MRDREREEGNDDREERERRRDNSVRGIRRGESEERE